MQRIKIAVEIITEQKKMKIQRETKTKQTFNSIEKTDRWA